MESSCVSTTTTDSSRKSTFPMIEVDKAIAIVLEEAMRDFDSEKNQVRLPLNDAFGHIVSQDFHSSDPFPPFPASIMDGYAVIAPLEPGSLPIIMQSGETGNTVSYITTGAMVPDWANAVVKIEDTELVERGASSHEKIIRIKVSIKPGENVRKVGSDINIGEVVLKRGERVGPAELGLLATIGISTVPCFKRPVVGVMSTGSELVNVDVQPIGSQIRDSNRPALIAAFKEDGYECIDLGIIPDDMDETRNALIDAATRCDVVVTSGGVSMGEKDFVKPLLRELGKIHFGRINMKPGKPTTFASFVMHGKKTLFFGLPGNPVSCLVTKTLFVDPALKRLQGLPSYECLHPQVDAVYQGPSITLDEERPEYHRVIVWYDPKSNQILVRSTGQQRSSRLLSMKSANGLVLLPRAESRTHTNAGDRLAVLLLKSLPTIPSHLSMHPMAASLDSSSLKASSPESTPIKPAEPVNQDSQSTNPQSPVYESFDSLLKTQSPSQSPQPNNYAPVAPGAKGAEWRTIKVGILTISDRAYHGTYKDESGPEVGKCLEKMSIDDDWPLMTQIAQTAIVPDDKDMIQSKIKEWSSTENQVDIILSTGGTGFGPRDITPEAVRPLLHREAPGVAQALLNEGLKYTPLAVMSRPVVGTINETLVCTLPGSVKAVRENISALKSLLPRMMELIKSGTCEARHHPKS